VINTEIKNGPHFTFRPRAGHAFATNVKPRTRDVSHGFFRRFGVVEFSRTFDPTIADIGLADRIIANELPGIAWWAIQHAVEVQRRGRIEIPTVVKAATASWRTDCDPVEQWLRERCEIGLTDPRDFTLASAAYDQYALWAQQRNHRALSDRTFYDRLKRLVDSRHGRRGSLYALRVLPLQDVVGEVRAECEP
jgi:putative DNA primase/helicase